MFGEMAVIVLNGMHASNQKIKDVGFKFKYTDLKLTFKDIYGE